MQKLINRSKKIEIVVKRVVMVIKIKNERKRRRRRKKKMIILMPLAIKRRDQTILKLIKQIMNWLRQKT